MGYRPQLFFSEEKQQLNFIGESNNFIPLFWVLIFANNPYTITVEDKDSTFPILTITPQELTLPSFPFNGEALACWQDFTTVITSETAKGHSLVLDLSDILIMNEAEEKLQDLAAIHQAAETLFTETIHYFANQTENELTYATLLGFCNLPEVKPENYPALLPPPPPTTALKTEKETTLLATSWLVLKGCVGLLAGIFLFLYCLFLLLTGSQWGLGISGVILFGLGTPMYGYNFFEEVKKKLTYLRQK